MKPFITKIIFFSFLLSTPAFSRNNSFLQRIKKFNYIDQTSKEDFRGIVELGDCSGAIITLKARSTYSKALVITNGHCLEQRYLEKDEALLNKRSVRSISLLSQNGEILKTLETSKIVYSTMTRTDIAIYELNVTYDELKIKYKIKPLIVDDALFAFRSGYFS